MADSKEIQVKEKQEVSPAVEQTLRGRVFTPDTDIFETDHDITLLAEMPALVEYKGNTSKEV